MFTASPTSTSEIAMNSPQSSTEQQPHQYEASRVGVELQSFIAEKKFSPRTKGVSEETKALCLVPLQDGWTREIRLRRTQEIRAADIYYYAPDGTRSRSSTEIMKYLEKNSIVKYSIRNFSFYSEPLGGDCAPHEVVRKCNPNMRPRTLGCQNDALMTVPPTTEIRERDQPSVAKPPKKRKPRNPLAPLKHNNPNVKLYCICTDIEWGQMVKCCNEGCVIKLYHSDCVLLRQMPEESQPWYCPICRGTNPETLHPAYAVKSEPP